MKPNSLEECNFYPQNSSLSRKISRNYFLFRTEICLESHFESDAVGRSLQNATDNFAREELKLSSYEEWGYGNKTAMI